MTPNKFDYSPNKVLYPKNFYQNANEEEVDQGVEPKKEFNNNEFMNPLDQDFAPQKPNKPSWRNPFSYEEIEDESSADNNFLASFWDNQPIQPFEKASPRKNAFLMPENAIKILNHYDENEEGLKTPQKPSFLNPRGKLKTSTIPRLKKEEKSTINFRNYCPELSTSEYLSSISYSFPRQQKKENPYWQLSKFQSEKKSAYQEKMSSFRKNPLYFPESGPCSLGDTPHRSERGLRVLSLRVRDIVCEKNHTTYKQVAESLINQMESQQDLKENVRKIY